jgi:hypothetical protein
MIKTLQPPINHSKDKNKRKPLAAVEEGDETIWLYRGHIN